jgi:hypothetical protein
MRAVARRTNVPRPVFAAVWAAAIVLPATAARTARADVSSWFTVGGGYALQRNADTATRDRAPAFTYSIGVGSSPLATLVAGIVFRGTTMFQLGTDVGAAMRLATGGFARGTWGVALDAGAAWRSWGDGSYGRWPLQAVITLGLPWGLQVAAGGELWSIGGGHGAQGAFAALELDLLRLTVMRQGSGEQWWPNPNPAGGRTASNP